MIKILINCYFELLFLLFCVIILIGITLRGVFNNMKKVEDVKKKKKQPILDDIFESDDYTLSERIIDLCLWYQIEDSHNMIRLFDSEIKMYEAQKQALLNNCIFKFQKKKIEKDLEEIDNKIHKLYENISDEVSIISEMEESIIRDETSEYKNSNNLVSYYELLSLLKMSVIYKKVILHKFDDTMTYIFDGDNYIIEDENYINDRFEMFLSECDTDISKLDKNIQLVDNNNFKNVYKKTKVL